MDIYTIAFYATSFLAVPLWLLMIVLPKAALTQRVMKSVYTVVPFAIPYALLELPHLSDALLFAMPSPEKIGALFTHPHSVVLAWIHFVPVDLFAGRWIYLDSRRQGLNAWLMAPILTFCLLLTPLGMVLYFLYRLIAGKPGLTQDT